MLRVPVSLRCPPEMRTIPPAAIESTEASLRREPEWQKRQSPRGAGSGVQVEEDLAAPLGRRGQRRVHGVPQEPVEWRVVGDQRRLVRLDGESEEEREVVLQQRELVGGRVAVPLADDRRRAVRRDPDELRASPTTSGWNARRIRAS